MLPGDGGESTSRDLVAALRSEDLPVLAVHRVLYACIEHGRPEVLASIVPFISNAPTQLLTTCFETNQLHCAKVLLRHFDGTAVHASVWNELVRPHARSNPLLWSAVRSTTTLWMTLWIQKLECARKSNASLGSVPWFQRTGNGHLVHVALRAHPTESMARAILAPCAHEPAALQCLHLPYGGVAPIHVAVQQRNVDKIRLLVDLGADANATSAPYSDTPLEMACAMRQCDMIEVIARSGGFQTVATWCLLFGDYIHRRMYRPSNSTILSCARALSTAQWREMPDRARAAHMARCAVSKAHTETVYRCSRLAACPFDPPDVFIAECLDPQSSVRLPVHNLRHVDSFSANGNANSQLHDSLFYYLCLTGAYYFDARRDVQQLCCMGWEPSAQAVCLAIFHGYPHTKTVLEAVTSIYGHASMLRRAECRVMYRGHFSMTPLQSALLVGSVELGRWLLTVPGTTVRANPLPPLGYTIVEGQPGESPAAICTRGIVAKRSALQELVRDVENLRLLTYAHVRLAFVLGADRGQSSLCTDLLEKVCSDVTYKGWWRSGTLISNGTNAVTRRGGGSALRQIVQTQ